MKLPDRWLQYSEGTRISSTRFVAFKVPLRENFNSTLSSQKSFPPSRLLKLFPKLKLVIDLTNTRKYYNGVKEFETRGIKYVKLKCQGHVIPSEEIFKKFVKVVDEFIDRHPQDDLIGVHCTHGVNRTGYLIVRYMIERLGYTPDKALREFSIHRGHAIERTNYVEDLKQRYTLKLEAKRSRKSEIASQSKSYNTNNCQEQRKNKALKVLRKTSVWSRGVEETDSKSHWPSHSIPTSNRFRQLSDLDPEI